MPKLWTETIEAHRTEVRDAILDTAAALLDAHGIRALTMSQIAEQTGIGRATLYKYFPDVDAILVAWHDRQITVHLAHLGEIRDGPGSAAERLEAVLDAYARIAHASHRHGPELVAFFHRDEQVVAAQRRLRRMIRDLIAEGAAEGAFRDDVAPDELASYCLHALTAARAAPTNASVRRLLAVTVAGLRPAR